MANLKCPWSCQGSFDYCPRVKSSAPFLRAQEPGGRFAPKHAVEVFKNRCAQKGSLSDCFELAFDLAFMPWRAGDRCSPVVAASCCLYALYVLFLV